MDVPENDMDTFIGKLLTYKMIVNELGKETLDRSEVDDSTLDLDFYIDKVGRIQESFQGRVLSKETTGPSKVTVYRRTQEEWVL